MCGRRPDASFTQCGFMEESLDRGNRLDARAVEQALDERADVGHLYGPVAVDVGAGDETIGVQQGLDETVNVFAVHVPIAVRVAFHAAQTRPVVNVEDPITGHAQGAGIEPPTRNGEHDVLARLAAVTVVDHAGRENVAARRSSAPPRGGLPSTSVVTG